MEEEPQSTWFTSTDGTGGIIYLAFFSLNSLLICIILIVVIPVNHIHTLVQQIHCSSYKKVLSHHAGVRDFHFFHFFFYVCVFG